jgi:hypothetical protein
VHTSWIALLTGALLTFGLPSQTDAQALTRYVLQTDRVLTDEATASGLTYVSHVAVARSGTIFVLDHRARAVEVLTPQGKRVATAGGPGSGPGEFRTVGSMGLTSSGFWVSDPVLRRVTRFSANGRVEQTISVQGRVEEAPQHAGMNIVGVLPDGSILQQTKPLSGAMAGSWPLSGKGPSMLRTDTLGRVLDTVATMDGILGTTVSASSGGRPRTVLSPVQPRTIVEYSADGSSHVIVRQPQRADGGFMLDVSLVTNGRVRYRRTVRIPSIRMNAGTRSYYLERSDTRPSSRERSAVETMLGTFRELPGAQHALVARDGRVWIQRQTPDSARTWLILDTGGSPTAQLTTPPRLQLFEADGTYAWGVQYDEDGAPKVVRYRQLVDAGR